MYSRFKSHVYPLILEKRKENNAEDIPAIILFREYISNYLEGVLERKIKNEKFDIVNNEQKLFDDIENKNKATWKRLYSDRSHEEFKKEESDIDREFGQLPRK